MSYSVTIQVPFVRETPHDYASTPFKEMVYEISLRTAAYSGWLKELQGAHRLVQILLQGQLLDRYQLLDFIIWPEGLFARVTMKNSSSLSDFLAWVKERSRPAGESSKAFWDDELQWIKLVPPDQLSESTGSFLRKAEALRREVNQSRDGSPNLLFYYRDQQLTR